VCVCLCVCECVCVGVFACVSTYRFAHCNFWFSRTACIDVITRIARARARVAYSILANAVGAALKAAYPNEVFIGPAAAGFDWTFLQTVFASGALAWFDAVSVHPYRSGPPETVLAEYAKLAALIASYSGEGARGSIPIVSGEWGYSTCVAPCWEAVAAEGREAATAAAAVVPAAGALGGVSEVTQADYLVRRFLLDAIGGVASSIWYDWHDDGSDPTSNEANFGTTRAPYGNASAPYVPKPAYTAAAALAAWRRGYVFAGRLNATGPVFPVSAYQFIAAFAAAATVTAAADVPGDAAAAAAAAAADAAAVTPTRYAVWAAYGGDECVVDTATMQDCGYWGIDEATCVTTRGCCFQEPYVAGPQCFFHTGPVNLTFGLPPGAAHGACFSVKDVYGGALRPVCANPDGTLTVVASPSPVFVSGGGWLL
jgi:hypothetical protein